MYSFRPCARVAAPRSSCCRCWAEARSKSAYPCPWCSNTRRSPSDRRARLGLDARTIDDILDYVCQVARRREIFFLWRPFLKDPNDDLVLELAVESESEFIITYNRRDFAGIETFGVKVLTPKEFLQKLGEIK